MAYVQPNKMLPTSSRVIRPYSCAFISTEGPNILGKLNMSGVEIPYNTQFTTRMVLNPDAKKQPVLYGFLGKSVTFLLLKFTYDETDPLCIVEEEQYIRYYFEDQPTVMRYANKILLLTGNSNHRIPQIYLENPGEVKVYVDAMVASLEQSDINVGDLSSITVTNLYHNNILSDNIWVQSQLTSGSTQLQIMNSDGVIEVYVDYNDILNVETDYANRTLSISTDSDTKITLEFLSYFEMYQARSRISWVMKLPNERYLTADYPSVDLVPPVFGLNPYIIPISENTYVYPYSGGTVYPSEIINYFITGITDSRDGIIPVNNTVISIREYGHVETLTGITSDGVYDVIMTISDNANNKSMLEYTLIFDGEPPVITFKPVASGTLFSMTVTDMALPSQGIVYRDIINKSVDNIYDTVDGTISNLALLDPDQGYIQIDMVSGTTGLTHITVMGDYLITYFIMDRAGNSSTYQKTVRYIGDTVLVAGDTYTFAPNVMTMNFEYYGATGLTATIVISGHSFLVGGVSGTTNEEFVWDIGGLGEYNFGSGSTGTITVTIEGILYTISFTGRGSLFFTITNSGTSPDYFTIDKSDLSFDYQSGLTDTFIINTNKDWTAVVESDYVSLSSTSGTGTSTITVTTLQENNYGYNLYDLITITVDSGSIHDIKTITTTQSYMI